MRNKPLRVIVPPTHEQRVIFYPPTSGEASYKACAVAARDCYCPDAADDFRWTSHRTVVDSDHRAMLIARGIAREKQFRRRSGVIVLH